MERRVGVGLSKVSEKAKRYVNEVLDNPWIIHGKFIQKFEKEFSKLHDCKFGLVTNSGTSSLHIALQALKEIHGWEDNDEVIVPAVTFVATSNIVIHNNMKPVFVDVEKEYYGINPELIEQKITERTKAIIVVHLFGQPCNMDPIMKIAEKHSLKVIEDSCETMFAKYHGKAVGSFGHIGCFSMYVAHIISAGVGGINTTNNEEYAKKLISLMNHGRDNIFIDIGDDKEKTKDELRNIISKRFSFINIGHSFRISEMEGAIAVAELEDYQENIMKRRENAKYLIDNLQEEQNELQLPQIRLETEHSFMMFPIVLKNQGKIGLVNHLENNGVETRDMLPLINQPIYQELFKINEEEYPIAKWINESGFYVGCHQHLTKGDLDVIIRTIKNYFQKKDKNDR